MHDSPRIRRLKSDYTALQQVCRESSIFAFDASGNPPCHYRITFIGKGLCRDRGKIKVIHKHQVEIRLGASYPRTVPEIRWLSPIYHPNISEIGMVCLGGYGTHWVPSVQLDELCTMLWDMVRYHNYDIRSPYNRDAALWVANQTAILFPTDARALRDRRVAQGRLVAPRSSGKAAGPSKNGSAPSASADGRPSGKTVEADEPSSAINRVRMFIQRYGRVFGDGSATETDGPPAVTTASTDASTEAQASPVALSQDMPALLSRESGNSEGTATPPASGSAPAQVPATVEPRRGDEESSEAVIMLENDPAGRADQPARPARRDGSSDEIIFID
jgi:ubiquitin-protein ligase